MAARTNSLAKGLVWNNKLSNWAFGILTAGALLYAIPTFVIGMEQTRIAHDLGYFYARIRSAVEPMKFWMWLRIVPDSMMLIGGVLVFFDLILKTYFAKKIN
jgi:nitric oxide reductase subunit B